jgi:hypothetical protein
MKQSGMGALRSAMLGLSLFGFAAHLCAAGCAPSVDSFDGPQGRRTRDEGGVEIQRCNGEPVGFSPTDPNGLPKCACAVGGAARCVPKEGVPAALAASLESCDNGGPGACVPDSLVKSGGAAPTTCQSSLGEGRCMSICIPEIGKNADALTRGDGDVCNEDERCTPCLDPQKNNEPTGVCEIGKTVECKAPSKPNKPNSGGSQVKCPYTGPPVIDVAKLPPCGAGAHCIPTDLAGPAAAQLKKCEGPAGSVCAPDKSIQAGGQYLPKTCNAVANAEGRCINVVIPAIEAQKKNLTKDICDESELCAPCFDPTSGKDTGVCKTVSCDSPKKPATTFKACCTKEGGESRAKCVPTTVIPAEQQQQLDDDDGTCVKDEELCVPNEMLQPNYKGGVACQAKMIFLGEYEGVCLSDCLDGVGILPRSTCEEGFKCVPCERGGKPTGAPGCKNTPP